MAIKQGRDSPSVIGLNLAKGRIPAKYVISRRAWRLPEALPGGILAGLRLHLVISAR